MARLRRVSVDKPVTKANGTGTVAASKKTRHHRLGRAKRDLLKELNESQTNEEGDKSVIIVEVKPPSRRRRRRRDRQRAQTVTSQMNKSIEVTHTRRSDSDKYPHLRENCKFYKFKKVRLTRSMQLQLVSQNRQYCATCYCAVCDVLASQCHEWNVHCNISRS